MNCPPVSRAPTPFNVRTDCVGLLSSLLEAYYKILSGSQRITVRYGERWVEYQKANVEELRTQYQVLYNQCPNAAASGLPNLNPALQSRRGPPQRGFSTFGRL
jgi:hypothetical protein